MEDILASIKKVIAEEKEMRVVRSPESSHAHESPRANDDDPQDDSEEDDVLELTEPVPAADLGPPLLDGAAADASREALEQLSHIAAISPPPPPPVNPLEEVVREMLRPILKQWIDEHLPRLVDEHVKREISRITGKPV